MWAMVYFKALPLPLRELDPDFLEILFRFANTYTADAVYQGYAARRNEEESKSTADQMLKLGYTDEDIAGMDLQDG
jgi:hypothetical protein